MAALFETEFICGYQSLKTDLTVTFPQIVAYMQETTLRHTEYIGYPMELFIERKCCWAITHWQVELYDYPKWNDKITAKTWSTSFKGYMAERCFELYNDKGKCLAKANTNWVFTNTEKKKAVRPPEDLLKNFEVNPSLCMEKDFKFPSKDSYKKINERELIVPHSDIDANLHVNNVKYIERFVNGFDIEFYKNNNIVSMKTVYRKSAYLGEKVIIETYANGTNEYIGLIKSVDSSILTEIYTKWEK